MKLLVGTHECDKGGYLPLVGDSQPPWSVPPLSRDQRPAAPVGQWAAPALASLAAPGTVLYLRPVGESTANLMIAALVLALPLLTRWPLRYHQVARAAAVWTLLGLPGAYIFGTQVLLIGGLTALVLLLDAGLLRRAQARAAGPGSRGRL